MHSAIEEKSERIEKDIALAQSICKELRAGNENAIITIYG